MKSYLCFPVVHFHYQGQQRQKCINTDNLPHLDDNDDWWDYWFSIGKYTYQLRGDFEDKMRLFRNLKIYVYPVNSTLTDQERIDEISKVTISFERQ